MNDQKMDVTVLLPCFNEQEAIPVVVHDIRAAMDGTRYRYEIMLVDDNSTDDSAAIALSLGCRIIRRPVRKGAGASRRTGILASQADIIVMLDTDGTYTAADIPRLLEYFPEYDQVNGARTSEQGTIAWLRYPTKWFIRQLAQLLAGQKIPDLNTGLKAFKRKKMLQYLWVIPDGFSCVSSMTLAFLCNDHPVKYIPTVYHRRIGRSKFHPVKDTYLYLITICRLITYFDPIRIFFPMALLLIFGGILKSIFDYIFVIGRLQLSDVVLILGGVTVFFLGLLSDLIVAQHRTYRHDACEDRENQ